MKKWFIYLPLVALIFILMIPFQANAEGRLHLQAEVGVENRVKYDSPTVLKITVTNNGEAFSGDFVVDNLVNYRIGGGVVVPLDLAPGEVKTIPIYLSGVNNDYYNYNFNTPQQTKIFTFYEGGIEKGKVVPHDGAKDISPRMMGPYSTIAVVVTTRKDEIRAFEDLRKPLGEELYTYYTNSLNDPYLPEDAQGLAGIDLIVFDDIALNDLSNKQQEAIYTWVQKGGTVAFAPTLNANLSAGIFKGVLPLAIHNEAVTVPKEVLKSYTNIDTLEEPITILSTEIQSNSFPSFQLDGYTFAAQTPIGRGTVVQFAFPLYDPVMTSLRDYGQIMKNSLVLNQSNMGYSTDMTKNLAADWNYINELFETFNISIWVLVVGIIAYMLVAGPIIYAVLRRKDKREKMWFVIPALAVVTSLIIFIVGAKDRLLSPQMQSMALYEIGEDGTLTGIFNNALLSNRSGEFTLEMDANTDAISSSQDGGNPTNLHKKAYIKETSNGKELALLNFGFWTVQNIVGETVLPNGGELISNLILKDGQLTGTVKNTLPVDLNEAKIISGANEFDLGTIKAGEEIKVDIATKKTIFSGPSPSNSYYNYWQGSQNFDLQKEQLYQLKEAAIRISNRRNLPIIVGWSDISLAPIELQGNSKQTTISYFVKSVPVEAIVLSKVSLTNEHFDIALLPNNLNTWGQVEDSIQGTAYISEGAIPLHYSIQDDNSSLNLKWTSLDIKYQNEHYDLTLINKVTGEEIILKDGKFTVTENVEQFIGDPLTIELIIERFPHFTEPFITLPKIELKGEPVK